ncbi:MAG: YneF family protein [Mycoplasmoidaceae bacterium]|nr:YneF family protein [Mycoplasmoidaceae bacterium]
MSGGALAGLIIGCIIGGLIIGLIIGFFISQKYFKKQLKDNPPITREQIKAM